MDMWSLIHAGMKINALSMKVPFGMIPCDRQPLNIQV